MNLMIFIAVAILGAGVIVENTDVPTRLSREHLSPTLTRHSIVDSGGARICYEDRSVTPTLWECWNE